jgi:hypothetical protein
LLYINIPKYGELSAEEKLIYHNDEDEYNRKARRGGKILYFARSGTEGETWVPLVEKAFAKLHGDYGSLCGGVTGEAIEDMTKSVVLPRVRIVFALIPFLAVVSRFSYQPK